MNNVIDLNEARLRKADEQFEKRMVLGPFVPDFMHKLEEVRKEVENDER